MRNVPRQLIFAEFFILILAIAALGQEHSATCNALRTQMRDSRIPNVAIAIFNARKIQTAYCSTDETPVSADSVFEAASLSKPIFAAGVLTLVLQHKLNLDRPLSGYFGQPYSHEQNPLGNGPKDVVLDPRLKQVTARMVLSHTAGLPNWSRNRPLTFLSNPGERWSYSGEGYIYLQRVIERITGEPLDAFLQESVLRPLGMVHSSFVWQANFSKTLLPGHTSSRAVESPEHFRHPLASSTLYTTLDDYARFVSKLLRAKPGSPFAMEEMKQVDVRPDLDLAWSLGLAIENSSPTSYFHWGANPGFQSFFLCQPRTGRAVLFFTDSDNGLDLADSIVNQAVPGSHPSLRFPLLHPKD